jgi:hypothetical protein
MLNYLSRWGARGALLPLCLIGGGSAVVAQPTREAAVPLQRMDFRDLGYRNFNEIPADAAFITALAAAPDGRIFGATSGVRSHLFVFSPKTNQVRPLGTIADAKGVHHSLAVDPRGPVYIGTGRDLRQTFTIKPDLSFGTNHISLDLWTQLKEFYKDYPGGHLYSYDPTSEKSVKAEHAAALTDLGIPVAGDGIYAMTLDSQRQVLYGLTYPHGHFFTFDLKQHKASDKGAIGKLVQFGGPDDRTLRTLPRDLVVAATGDVYTSTDEGHILRFDIAKQELQTLAAEIPGESMQVVEAWVKVDDTLYGGTSEGFLFRFHPSSGEVDNLGKPMVALRIRGLAAGRDGMVYGLAGDRSVPNLLFRYDPAKHRLETLGGVAVNRSPYYLWKGQQFDAMATGTDGTIYMGESDRGGHLFFYIP